MYDTIAAATPLISRRVPIRERSIILRTATTWSQSWQALDRFHLSTKRGLVNKWLLYDAQRFPYRALNPTQSREIPMGAYQTVAA
jgi:hypothetical protein